MRRCQRNLSNKLGPSDLWIADADGKNERRLTTDDRWYDHPDRSPDGTRIVCCSNRDGAADNEIFIYTLADGRWERPAECAALYPVGVGLFSFFPESVVRRLYPDSYFGTETYPHWAAAGR